MTRIPYFSLDLENTWTLSQHLQLDPGDKTKKELVTEYKHDPFFRIFDVKKQAAPALSKRAIKLMQRITEGTLTVEQVVIAVRPDGRPTVEADVNYRPGVWTLKIVCPYCGATHTHGGGTGNKPEGGHRASHCVNVRGRGYVITIPD